ncbi:DeoR/GlpR family DNA-binding transcription regulator [bacterium]|nr:DeoR/GlpR family DNA-binding transcription regulator [bacterium]
MKTAHFKEERHQIIRNLIDKFEKVTVEDLASKFYVSVETVRRDLNELEAQGHLKRTYGGAVKPDSKQNDLETYLMDRLMLQADEKKRIAMSAANTIKPGETIYLSPGSTNYYLAERLNNLFELTVLTNSLVITNLLAKSKNVDVIVLGGMLKKSEMSLGYIFNEDVLSSIHLDKAFLGCQGIHHEKGITTVRYEGVGTDSSIARVNKNVIVLADSTKIGAVGDNQIAPIDYVGACITTEKAPEAEVDALQERGIKVYQV